MTEIERLQAEIERLEAEVEHWQCENANGVELIRHMAVELDQSRTNPRVVMIAISILVELLDVIAGKLEHGDDPDELARYIRQLIGRFEAAERPLQ